MTIENGNIIIDFEKLTLDEVAVMLGEMLQRGEMLTLEKGLFP